MADAEELVRLLRSFRTRKEAMERLVDMGGGAVDALIQALDGRNEGSRWAAMRCLGETGDDRALKPLIRRLDHRADQDVACWALGQLTGEALGGDPEAWRKWHRDRGGAVAPNDAESVGDETLFAEAVRGLSATVQTSGRSRNLTVALEGGRRQTVRVVLDAKDFEGEAVVLVYSECGPAEPSKYEFALRFNLSLPYGALALRGAKGQERLVMLNSLLRAGLTPLALRKSIVTVAAKADAIEKRLTGQDKR